MKQPKLTYQEAQKRLEEIVREIESNEHDIDRLCDQLKEAKELIAFCKQKLYKVEEEVKTILNKNGSEE